MSLHELPYQEAIDRLFAVETGDATSEEMRVTTVLVLR